MHHAYRVLHKLLAILKIVIRFSRQFSHFYGPYHIVQRIFGALTSKSVRSSAAYPSDICPHELHCELERGSDVLPVAILPSLQYSSESWHSVNSGHADAEGSPPGAGGGSNHVSVSIESSIWDNTPPILRPMTASDIRRYSKKSQMYVLNARLAHV
jgi:hypothetical protein